MRSFSDWLIKRNESVAPEIDIPIEDAGPAHAPTKTPTKPKVTPEPIKKPNKRRDPFTPEKPQVVPGPKQAGPTVLPAEPEVKPTVTPEKDPPPKRKSPFTPEKPKVVPGPKQSAFCIREGYEEEAHKRLRNSGRRFRISSTPRESTSSITIPS